MASGKRPPNRKRPPPVIDLDATEVAQGPVSPEKTAAPVPPEAAADPAPSPAPEAMLQTPPPEPPQEPPPEPPHADPEPPRRPQIAWLPPDIGARISSSFSSPLLAAGLAGAGAALLELLVLWSFGLLGASNPAPVAAQPDTVTPRLAAIETQLKELGSRPLPANVDPKVLEAINTRLAKVERDAAQPRPASPSAPDPALANRIANVEGSVKLLTDNIAALGQRSSDLSQRANDVAKRADDAVKRADALTTHVTNSSNDVAKALHETRTQLDALSASLKETQDAARQSATGSDRALRVVVAASALRTAVERGEPFAAELATIKALTKDTATLAPLEPFATSGVPSSAALAHELSELIQPMLRTANTAPRDGGILDKLQANAEKLVRIRRVGEAQPGDDPTAVIARIEAKAANADIAGALSELGKLPPATRAPAQAWIAKAQARGSALDASRKLAADAIAGLNANPGAR